MKKCDFLRKSFRTVSKTQCVVVKRLGLVAKQTEKHTRVVQNMSCHRTGLRTCALAVLAILVADVQAFLPGGPLTWPGKHLKGPTRARFSCSTIEREATVVVATPARSVEAENALFQCSPSVSEWGGGKQTAGLAQYSLREDAQLTEAVVVAAQRLSASLQRSLSTARTGEMCTDAYKDADRVQG